MKEIVKEVVKDENEDVKLFVHEVTEDILLEYKKRVDFSVEQALIIDIDEKQRQKC